MEIPNRKLGVKHIKFCRRKIITSTGFTQSVSLALHFSILTPPTTIKINHQSCNTLEFKMFVSCWLSLTCLPCLHYAFSYANNYQQHTMTKFNIVKSVAAEIITKKWITILPTINLQYMPVILHSIWSIWKKNSLVLSRNTNAHIHRAIQSDSTHKTGFNLLPENKYSHGFNVNWSLSIWPTHAEESPKTTLICTFNILLGVFQWCEGCLYKHNS
jgi:hypothetical protein